MFFVGRMVWANTCEFLTFQVSQDQAKIYTILKFVNDKTELNIIDSVSGRLIKKINLPLIAQFSWHKPNLAISLDQEKAYITDINKILYVVDIARNKVYAIKGKPIQDIGKEASSAMSLSLDGKRLYVADGVAQLHSPAVIHVVDTMTDNIVATVDGNKGWWRGVSTLDNDSSHLYISNQKSNFHNEIYVLNTKTQQLNQTKFEINNNIVALAISPKNGNLYATGESHIYVFDVKSEKLIDTIYPDKAYTLKSIAFSPQGNKFYTMNVDTGTEDGVIVFDVLSKKSRLIKFKVQYQISDDSELKSSADGSKIYAFDGHTIHVIDTATDEIIRDLDVEK
jgi:DNA-binding beta-propeller fold protein YncE